MGGLPNDKDARKCLKVLQRKHSWIYRDDVMDGGHGVGALTCGGGCLLVIYRTPKGNQAQHIWKYANKCTHGKAPGREHW